MLITLLVTFATFLSMVVLHIIVHRIVVSFGIITFKTISVFLLGYVISLCLLLYLDQDYLLSATALYTFLVFDFLAFLATPILGDRSPSSEIYLLCERFKRISHNKLITFFTNEDLIEKRLRDLEQSGAILKKNKRYYIKQGGARTIGLIGWYRSLLKWKRVG